MVEGRREGRIMPYAVYVLGAGKREFGNEKGDLIGL
jgi:hypothetical protein